MKRQIFGAALVKAAVFFFSYAANYLLILTMNQADFGRFSLIMAIASIAAMLVSLGHPQVVLRTVSGVLANGKQSRIFEIWRFSHFWIIGSGLGFLLLALLSLGVVSEGNWALQLIPASLILPMWALLKLHAAVLHGSHMTTIGQAAEAVSRPAVFCLSIGIGFLAAGQMSVILVLWLNFAAFAVAFCLAILANLSLGTYSVLKPSPIPEPEADNAGWFRASFSLAMISAIQLLIINTDAVMIGAMMSDEDVAVYRVAMLIALVIAGANEIVTVVARPKVAAAFASSELARVVPAVRRLALLATVAALISLGIFLLLGEAGIARIFGEDYAPAFQIAIILIFAQVVAAYIGPVEMMLNMAKLEREHLVVVICVIAANAALNYLLIPIFGLYGAAYASLATMCIWRISGVIQFERRTRIVYLGFNKARH